MLFIAHRSVSACHLPSSDFTHMSRWSVVFVATELPVSHQSALRLICCPGISVDLRVQPCRMASGSRNFLHVSIVHRPVSVPPPSSAASSSLSTGDRAGHMMIA
eukprot:3048412-Rhodomonas_salina.2